MSATAKLPIAVDEGFTTVAELRAAHSALLQQESDGPADPSLLWNIRTFLDRGVVAGLFLDNERERRASQSMLDYWATVLYRGTGSVVDSTLYDFDIERAPEIAEDQCPYLGLEAFGEPQHAMFFGRARIVQQYLRHLEKQRLLAVVGQSGSGKSSLVLAGLLPQLREDGLPDSSQWAYLPRIVPGKEPLVHLGEGLFAFLIHNYPHARKRLDAQRQKWMEQFVAGALHDGAYLARQIDILVQKPVVLVIDQFEEIFTVCENEAARQALISNLLTLLDTPGLRHIVILTMRSEYDSYVARFQRLSDAFDQARLSVTPMVPSELREAIEEPARSVGLKIEPSVVDALVADIVGEPAALPLLQFTLLKLWEKRERNRVTREAYKRLGGGRIALERSADEFYDGLSLEQQTTVRRLLLRMVRPTDGLEFTNNRVQISELQQIGEPIERIDEVLTKLMKARLIRLTPGETWSESQVEVAHEALVRNWQKLSDWLEQARQQLRERRKLTLAAEQWQSLGRDVTTLLRGRTLKNALYLDMQELSKIERDFLHESELAQVFEQTQEVDRIHTLAEAKRQQAEADRQRALAEAKTAYQSAQVERHRAEERDRTAKRLRLFVTGLAIALLITVVATSLALYSYFDADRQRSLAQIAQKTADASAALRATDAANSADRADQLAQINVAQAAVFGLRATQQALLLQATQQAAQDVQGNNRALELANQSLQENDPLRALQLAKAAADLSLDKRIENALQRAIQLYIDQEALRLGQDIPRQSGAITQISWNPDSRHFVASSSDESAQTWEFNDTGSLQRSTFSAPSGTVSTSWSTDGQRIASAESNGAISVWDPITGRQLITIQGHRSRALSIAWSADSRMILSTGSDATIRLWDANSGAAMAVFTAPEPRVTWAAWSPDRQRFVSFSKNTIAVWRWADNVLEFSVSQPGIVRSAAWAPDGNTIVTAASDGAMRIWNANNGDAVGEPIISGASLNSAIWSPSGTNIVTGSDDGTLSVWDTASRQELSHIQINATPITFVGWSPDSRRIVAGSHNGALRAYYVYLNDILDQARVLLAGREIRF